MVPGLLDRPPQKHPSLYRFSMVNSIQDEKERARNQLALAIDTARTILDMPVAYSFLKPGTVSGKVVGACGTITSIIGLYQMWK